MRLTAAHRRLLLASVATFGLAVPAAAQTAGESAAQATTSTTPDPSPDADERSLGDIVVTATKRASTVQDVPFSINAQTQEDIQRANASTIEDISRNVAGLQVQNLGPGQSQVSVRGVSAGQIVRDQPGVKEQVGIYLDESVVSLSLFTPDFDLFDLNRVETLRGPQGTLFGSGSVGGTIRYITNQPRIGVTEGAIEANLNTVDGNDVGYHLKGAINLPLGPTAALRVVGYGTHYAGFIDAIGPAAASDVNDGDRVGTRISLLWQPTDGLKITPRFVYQKVEADGFNRAETYNFFSNQFTTTQPRLREREQYLVLREKFQDKTRLADLTASYDFGGVELTSVTSYINRDILVSRDASALTGSVYVSFAGAAAGAAGGARLPSNLVDTTDLKQWTQEVRLGSTGSGPFQWVLGGFYSKVDRQYSQRLPTPGSDPFGQVFLDAIAPGTPISATRNGFPADSPYNADIPYDIKQKAVFGEASYDLGQIKLTAGGRYYDFKESRDFISGGIFANGDRRIGDRTKSDGFTPRAIVTWEPNRNLSVNLQAAKGFRLGGVNDPLNLPLCDDGVPNGPDARTFGGRPIYKDETLWNYEAGLKFSRGPVTFNAAAYYNDIKNLQVTADAGSCSSRVVFNVPKAHAKGIEAEFNVRPVRGLDLSFAGSLIDAEFDSSVLAADNPATPTVNEAQPIAGIRDGNRLPTVPRYQYAASATYGQPLGDDADWFATASVQRVGNRFTQPGDQEPGVARIGNALFFDRGTGAYGSGVNNAGSFRLPAYTLVNLSAGIDWTSGLGLQLYVNNLFDKTPLLSLDRERGARARIGYNIGQPRTIGATLRYKFRDAPAPAPVIEPVAPPPPAPPAPPPATQTCSDGSVVLATDSCPVPPPPPPAPEPAPVRG